jgi:hypothetical protein
MVWPNSLAVPNPVACKQSTFLKELGELPASVRWEMQKSTILENGAVDITVRIASDHSDVTRDAQRLKRTKGAGERCCRF